MNGAAPERVGERGQRCGEVGRKLPLQSQRQCGVGAREHGACAHAKKGEARDGRPRCGPRVVQLRHESQLTSEEYVKQRAWESASLKRCPLHPAGGCGIARHTPYSRVEPPGMKVARAYCAEGHTTFSLLPDCLASRLSSTLAAVEEVYPLHEAGLPWRHEGAHIAAP